MTVRSGSTASPRASAASVDGHHVDAVASMREQALDVGLGENEHDSK